MENWIIQAVKARGYENAVYDPNHPESDEACINTMLVVGTNGRSANIAYFNKDNCCIIVGNTTPSQLTD